MIGLRTIVQGDLVIFKRRSLFPRISGIFLILVAVGVLGGLVWLTYYWVDWQAPQIQLAPEIQVLGPETKLILKVQDQQSGLKKLRVILRQLGEEKVIFIQNFPAAGWLGKGGPHILEIPFTLKPEALGFKDGPAELLISAQDQSRWGWGHEATVTRKLTIDLVPLSVTVRSLNHSLNQGGTGLIIYQVNKKLQKSGVLVNGQWFSGYPRPGGETGSYLAFFAVPWELPKSLSLEVMALDQGGAQVRKRVSFRLKRQRWRHDRINLSEAFLHQKMPEFQEISAELKNLPNPLEVFLRVNRQWRTNNHHRVEKLCAHSQPQRLWQGPFLRLQNSKPMAGFADHRTYFFQGREIDRQVHLGQDLASLKQAKVPAANQGLVVMAEPLGIYGQTVIIDHGWGLFSMYSHLSEIQAQPDQKVQRGEVIGLTGDTGLAGGDHLHFSLMVQGQFVNPREWYDSHWIKDNVERQLQSGRTPKDKVSKK